MCPLKIVAMLDYPLSDLCKAYVSLSLYIYLHFRNKGLSLRDVVWIARQYKSASFLIGINARLELRMQIHKRKRSLRENKRA